MTKKESFDESKLIVNPFVENLEIPVTMVIDTAVKSKTKPVFNTGDFQVWDNNKYYIEKTQSTSIYYSDYSKDRVYNLSDKAKSLYLFLLYNVKRGKDFIQLNREVYMKKNNIKSGTTVIEAIKELMRYGFIVNTEFQSVYWINPALFFSGSRIQKYPEKTRIVQEWLKEAPNP